MRYLLPAQPAQLIHVPLKQQQYIAIRQQAAMHHISFNQLLNTALQAHLVLPQKNTMAHSPQT